MTNSNDSNSLEVAKHGKLTFLKSQEALRKFKSEHESKSRLSDDTRYHNNSTYYESNIRGAILIGYLQTISRHPIVIHMHGGTYITYQKASAWKLDIAFGCNWINCMKN